VGQRGSAPGIPWKQRSSGGSGTEAVAPVAAAPVGRTSPGVSGGGGLGISLESSAGPAGVTLDDWAVLSQQQAAGTGVLAGMELPGAFSAPAAAAATRMAVRRCHATACLRPSRMTTPAPLAITVQ